MLNCLYTLHIKLQFNSMLRILSNFFQTQNYKIKSLECVLFLLHLYFKVLQKKYFVKTVLSSKPHTLLYGVTATFSCFYLKKICCVDITKRWAENEARLKPELDFPLWVTYSCYVALIFCPVMNPILLMPRKAGSQYFVPLSIFLSFPLTAVIPGQCF